MTDRNGNLNKNSRSGSREDGREPVRRNTAMNSREIMLERAGGDSQSKAQPRPWKSERGYRAGGSPCGAAAGTGFRKDGILDGSHPGKGSSES